jgi:hypothetical protein
MRNMNTATDRELQEFLRSNMPSVTTALRRDLWPAMLRHIEERPRRVTWIDWALAATVVGLLLLFPKAIPVLMYHL